jgi:hypothetical protein
MRKSGLAGTACVSCGAVSLLVIGKGQYKGFSHGSGIFISCLAVKSRDAGGKTLHTACLSARAWSTRRQNSDVRCDHNVTLLVVMIIAVDKLNAYSMKSCLY